MPPDAPADALREPTAARIRYTARRAWPLVALPVVAAVVIAAAVAAGFFGEEGGAPREPVPRGSTPGEDARNLAEWIRERSAKL